MLRKDLSLGVIALAIILVASLGLVLLFRGGGTNEAEAGLLPPIHYKCYQIPANAPVPTPPLVTLETQFGVEKDVRVGLSQFLCPPAVKTYNGASSGDLTQPHLKCYSIQSTDNPPHVVNLTDQFGTQSNVAVGPAVLLCMPVLKTIFNPLVPTPAPGTLPTVPHYKCYQITGPAPSASVTLDTQFGTENNVIVGLAQLLCAPAIKTKQVAVGAQPEGNLNAPHLKCYQITGPQPVPTISVNLHTQFGDETGVPVGAPQMLCQAVIKTVATPAIHYKCYDLPLQPLPATVVDLQTQFGTEIGVPVLNSRFLCPPAIKTKQVIGAQPEGDLNAPHLKCYDIHSTDNPGWTVSLTDQFRGAAAVTAVVGLATELCVPAVKTVISPPPPAPTPTPGPLPTTPHYKCYQIIAPPANATVKLETQFGIEPSVVVGQPVLLCAPAIKRFGGVATGDLSAPHLVCYLITDPPPGFVVNLQTQFGFEGPLNVMQAQLLCVPATKTVLVPTPTPSPTPSPTPPPLSIVHYKCYDITPQTLGVLVDLRTQFGFEQNVRVTNSKFLCPPVVKTVPPRAPEGALNGPHLKCYDIISTEVPIQVVTLSDQFTSQAGVQVGLPKELCVPALKAIPPNPLSGTLSTVPHYKCYQITGAIVNIAGVKLETQFGTENNVTVVQADRLCAPAIKTFGGVITGDLNNPHLVCYVIIPHISVSKKVDLLTQFGVETSVGVTLNQRLCVPATKTVTFPTPTPSPTPSPVPLGGIHYKCYNIPLRGLDRLVHLRTQFGLEKNVLVLQSRFLCPPVVKTVPGRLPEGDLNGPHLKCYDLQSADDPIQVVTLTDQFVSQAGVQVGLARELCVPANKAIAPGDPSRVPPKVPHYKCHEINGATVNIPNVTLVTQFGTETGVTVVQAVRLCAPAIKFHGGTKSGDLTNPHLVCYLISPQADPVPAVVVNLFTQFGLETNVPVGPAQRLCVPATKTVTFPAATPVPTPIICIPARPWSVPVGDDDCDGFPSISPVGSRGSELYIGTMPATACALNTTPNNEPLPDAWPMDNNDDRKASLADVLAYIPVFGTNVPPSDARFDINESGKINLADVLSFIPFFGQTC